MPVLRCSHNRKRANNIVCLDARDRYQRKAHGADHIMNGFNLLAQLFWHGRPICFVLRINIVSEGRTFGIENHDELIGRIIGL